MRYIDVNRMPGFMKAFRPTMAKQLESHIAETHNEMIRQWEQGNNIHGEPWQPNAPSTVAQKGHNTPLIELRDMIGSTRYEVDRSELAGGIIIEDEKAAIHEEGRPDLGIPPRPIMAPTAEHLERQMPHAVGLAIDGAERHAFQSGAVASGVGNFTRLFR